METSRYKCTKDYIKSGLYILNYLIELGQYISLGLLKICLVSTLDYTAEEESIVIPFFKCNGRGLMPWLGLRKLESECWESFLLRKSSKPSLFHFARQKYLGLLDSGKSSMWIRGCYLTTRYDFRNKVKKYSTIQPFLKQRTQENVPALKYHLTKEVSLSAQK